MSGSGIQKNKFNVLFLATLYPNRYYPLSGIFIRKHARCAASFANVTVISAISSRHIPLFSSETSRQTLNQVDEIIIYYSKFPLAFLRPVVQPLLFFMAFIKAYRLYGRKPDLLHVNIIERFGLPAWLLKILYHIPYIVTEHSSVYLPRRNAFRGIWKKITAILIIKNASAVTAVSEPLKEAMIQHKLRHPDFRLLPNVVDTELFIPSSRERTFSRKKIVNITNFKDSDKNTTGIIHAVKMLSRLRNDFELHFIGMNEGNDTGFEEMAAKSGLLNTFIFFDGLLQEQELANSLNESSFLVSFSNYETFLIAVPEAWACSIPVLSTRVGLLENHFHPGWGILTETGNIEKLAFNMNLMLDNYMDYDKTGMRQFVVDHFSVPVISTQLKDIYRKILKRSS